MKVEVITIIKAFMAGITIDQYDLSVYSQYAVRTMMNEQINQQLRLREASSIPPQIQIVDLFPRQNELDILLGIVPLHTPWAYFFPPKKLYSTRRSPFSFSRVAPSFGSSSSHDEELEILESIDPDSEDEKQEKAAILGVVKQLKKINQWIGFIVGRIGQFLQG